LWLETQIFDGCLDLLGEYTTGKRLACDGVTEMNDEDATEYALDWHVRDTEPLLFSDARAPQCPNTRKAPGKIMGNRLGLSLAKKEAEKVWPPGEMTLMIVSLTSLPAAICSAPRKLMNNSSENSPREMDCNRLLYIQHETK
jgi:hypothetical protein